MNEEIKSRTINYKLGRKMFKKECIRCGIKFRPAGKSQEICFKCTKGRHKQAMLNRIKKRGFKSVAEYEK